MSSAITMIGASQSGKTCYLYFTYDAMMNGINGFKFVPKDRSQGLFLQDVFDHLLESQKWPEGSIESNDFEFNVMYKGGKIGEFTWHDYRGGLLTEKENEMDVQGFLGKVYNSTCLVVAIPVDLLDTAINGTFQQQNRAKGILNNYLLHVAAARENRPDIPVVLAMTKGDLVERCQMSCEDAIKSLRDKFDLLFNERTGGSAMITRVSLGQMSGEMKQNTKIEFAEGNNDFKPKNVHIPILLPIYLDIKRQVAQWENSFEDEQDTIDRNRNYLSDEESRSSFSKWLWGDESGRYRNRIEESQQECQKAREKISELKEILSAIYNELALNNWLYYNGTVQKYN